MYMQVDSGLFLRGISWGSLGQAPHKRYSCVRIVYTIVSQVSTHGHLNMPPDFGPHGCLPEIRTPYIYSSSKKNTVTLPLHCSYQAFRFRSVCTRA